MAIFDWLPRVVKIQHFFDKILHFKYGFFNRLTDRLTGQKFWPTVLTGQKKWPTIYQPTHNVLTICCQFHHLCHWHCDLKLKTRQLWDENQNATFQKSQLKITKIIPNPKTKNCFWLFVLFIDVIIWFLITKPR